MDKLPKLEEFVILKDEIDKIIHKLNKITDWINQQENTKDKAAVNPAELDAPIL